jgi:hypothetical protein
MIPIILLVSSPNKSPVDAVQTRTLKETAGHRVLCNVFGVNNQVCKPSLTWHQGDYRYLNIDDTDRLGSEHYYANILDDPHVFKTQVYKYDWNDYNYSVVGW